MIRSIFLGFLLLAALPDSGRSSWGPRGCAAEPVGSRVPLSRLPAEKAGPRYTWKDSGDGDLYRLFDHGLEAATFRYSTDDFRWADGRLDTPPWGARPKPMAKPPLRKAEVPIPNFGLMTEFLHPERESYQVNGQEVSRQQAQAANEGPIPDDTGRKRISVIGGTEAERKRVTDDLSSAPALAGWKDQTIVQSYPADAWQVRPGFVTTGNPSIYYQDSSGRVLMRAESYEGPEQLAGALRRAAPDYDPNKDPTGKPKPVPVAPSILDQLKGVPAWAWLGVVGACVILLLPLAPVSEERP